MCSIFSKIINGDVPSYKIAEDDNFFAFLDIFPLSKGHVLVIPKKEIDYIFDIDDYEYKDFWVFAKKVSKGIKKAIPCERVGVAVIGLEVPHAHIHLIPLQSVEDINFSRPKLQLDASEFKVIAKNIKAEL